MDALVKHEALAPEVISALVLNGDLSKLKEPEKVAYVTYRCKQLGLDPAAKPFELLTLQGKQVLYATKACTEQLCESRKLSVAFVSQEQIGGVLVVTARVNDGTRSTENVGAVNIEGLKGDALANALMKCRTKAIRRTVLAHCGLGILDETEVETIPNAKVEPVVAPSVAPVQVEGKEVKVVEVKQPSTAEVVSGTTIAGNYPTPFGTKKGIAINMLTDDEIRKGIEWCLAKKKYPEWVENARRYQKDPFADVFDETKRAA